MSEHDLSELAAGWRFCATLALVISILAQVFGFLYDAALPMAGVVGFLAACYCALRAIECHVRAALARLARGEP
jgi:hypothetical protein